MRITGDAVLAAIHPQKFPHYEVARHRQAQAAHVAAANRTDALLVKHGVPPQQPHEPRRHMLTRLLDSFEPRP